MSIDRVEFVIFMIFAKLFEISDNPETSIAEIVLRSYFWLFLMNYLLCDGRLRERDGKSWELCNWNEDYDDDSVEIKCGDLRNPNLFLLSSFYARRFLESF
jgi:hypothetical protein